ncbi:hypothetical protein [Ktedonospora formicarum]|uniref:Uncharacterized protein n=1 Tax=Ktedonospora formicarum TaxID=2778364 RepID=A0A8J3I7X2_9CHLR|nr:hypothetical protein [Ktedonospora formicarum]GHO47448.1 hypothetical protein KSX_56110 [Ktedonospora formicarum]
MRAYSRAADELYGKLLHLHFHHPEEEKEQALRQALSHANADIERKHTLFSLSLSLYSYLKQTLPPERTHQRPTLRLPPQQEPAKEHPPQDP